MQTLVADPLCYFKLSEFQPVLAGQGQCCGALCAFSAVGGTRTRCYDGILTLWPRVLLPEGQGGFPALLNAK